MDNPLVQGSFALITGNFVGAISDRIVTIIDARVRMIESLKLGDKTGSLLDSVLGVFLHLGLISLGTKLVVGALPWVTEEAGSFILYNLGVFTTSQHLTNHLKILNQIVFDEALYSTEGARQTGAIEKKATDGDASEPSSSSS